MTTVVYIEADHTNALLMRFLLDSRADYALHHARDGRIGLEFCRRLRPDLVITEMRLPDVNACEVLWALREDPATASIPCIVLSSDAMPARIEEALAAGFDDYWTKPIDIWQLMQNIDDVSMKKSLRLHQQGMISVTEADRIQARLLGICTGRQNYWPPA